MDILLIAALLPAIVLMVYVYRKDSVEKEPIGLIARLFVLGAVAGPLAAIVENLAFTAFESARLPIIRPRAPRRMLLPAPVSPVMTEKPPQKSMSSRKMRA